MFLPGMRLMEEMLSDNGGLWFIVADGVHEPCICAKLTTHVLKSILRGAPTRVLVACLPMESGVFFFSGIRVDDMP